jgi:RimJ/RimL family protein N-acetyltransferase
VPRRLTAPDPVLADDAIRLEPLTQADRASMLALASEPDVARFTRVPARGLDERWAAGWVARYERGLADGSCAGFAVRDAGDGAFLGFAALVKLDLDSGEGEIGYMLVEAARGRGAATRAVRLLTEWGFSGLGLERLELRIDVANTASERVAERAGYRRDGVLRNLHVKEGVRADTAVWSRVRHDFLMEGAVG